MRNKKIKYENTAIYLKTKVTRSSRLIFISLGLLENNKNNSFLNGIFGFPDCFKISPCNFFIFSAFFLAYFLFSGCTDGKKDDTFNIIKDRIIALNTGNGIISDGSFKKMALRELEANAHAILEENRHLTHLDITAPGVESKVSGVFGSIFTLAKAFNTSGQKFYHSEDLLTEIRQAMQHAEQWIKPRSPRPGNWYYWKIDVPRNLGPALVLMQDFLDEELIKAQLAGMLDMITEGPYLTGANGTMEGINLIHYAVLTNDENKLRTGIDLIQIEMSVTNTKSGILEDYSYQFHDQLLYTGGYGEYFTLNAALAIYLMSGTKYEIPKEEVAVYCKFLIEHAQWTIVGNKFDISVRGRNIKTSPTVKLTAYLLMGQYPSVYQDEIKTIASRLLYWHHGSFSITDAPYADNYPQPVNTLLNGFRYFYKTDYGVSRKPDFYVSIKMISDKTMDYEFLTGMNEKGRNLSSGFTYMSRTGNEIWEHVENLESVYDWEYLPGTTARFGARPPKFSNFSESKFAGGVGSNENGIISFHLIPVVNDFHAKKSYFMFPSGFVALGSDISSKKAGTPVSTTITQWGMSERNKLLVLSGGKKILMTPAKETESLDWAYCDSVGYIFHDCKNIHLKKDSLYATIFMNHGSNPQKASYAYTVLPACSEQEVISYFQSPDVKILENSESIHALKDVRNNATGIVFWEAGSFDIFTVDHPAIVYYEEKNEGLALTVSNPFFNQDTIHLTINKKFENVDLPVEASVNTSWENTVITLNTANRRPYRIGFGEINVKQFPRENNLPYESFKILNVENTKTSTFLTVKIPEILENDFRLYIHYWQSFFEKELLPVDITDTLSSGVYTYKWDNAGTETRKHFNGNHSHTIRLRSGIHNVWDFFAVERE